MLEQPREGLRCMQLCSPYCRGAAPKQTRFFYKQLINPPAHHEVVEDAAVLRQHSQPLCRQRVRIDSSTSGRGGLPRLTGWQAGAEGSRQRIPVNKMRGNHG